MYWLIGVIYFIYNIFIFLFLPDIFTTILILVGTFLLIARFLLSKISIYRLFFLLITFIKDNMAFVLAIKKPFI